MFTNLQFPGWQWIAFRCSEDIWVARLTAASRGTRPGGRRGRCPCLVTGWDFDCVPERPRGDYTNQYQPGLLQLTDTPAGTAAQGRLTASDWPFEQSAALGIYVIDRRRADQSNSACFR
jgi:hypothetical protein